MNYDAKQPTTLARQLKVETLTIPFTLTFSATAANVVLRNDEPSLLFLASEGVTQITAALATNETATYSVAPDDSDGILNMLLTVGEEVTKVLGAKIVSRTGTTVTAAQLGSATGITTGSGGGKSIMLTADTAVNFSTTSMDACLEVSYTTAK